MKYNCIFVDVNTLAKAVAKAPKNVLFDITFDNEESVAIHGEPSGWHGIKVTTIFDEDGGVLCFGYYGGTTKCISVEDISEDIYDADYNAEAIEEQLLEWFQDEDDFDDVICVEITVENEEYLMEV
jgi:hypothetical protein